MPSKEDYYCGQCRRQQQPSQGERCVSCGSLTVTWKSGESESQTLEKWKKINGR